MGMNCGIVFAQRACAPSAAAIATDLLLISPASPVWRHTPLWESASEGAVALLELQDWHVVLGDVGPFLNEGLSTRLASLSKGGKVFCILAESTSGGLGFELHDGGRQLRRWLEVEGVVDANEGSPLQEEPAGLFTSEPDEDGARDFWAAVTLAEQVTGTSWDSLHVMQSEQHRAAP